ncbi:uncharacterized protein N7459_005030 [Penicillium hispanicum]|uniref:uncharacterized protein n=1 Tax=Penicillium hispanicum TaxID=1080232 RepID=UPI002540710B|nr:uncharacterized protein N7459_005030 [Penicillium hispanicum]KAJ5585230.1 hypothetical protein N7459_005030 [Penicillium hispanicum]
MTKPTLEGVPVELKILILFRVSDSDTLQSLVLASPGYYQAYLAVRPELLESLVKRQYTGFLDLAEALAAVRSQGVHFSSRREDAIFLLDRWRRRNEIHVLSQSFSGLSLEPDGVEETTKLLHFHKVLSFFLEDYSLNAPSPPWIPSTQWENEYLPLNLTPLEKCRFLRAICRFQILKNIFGDPVYEVELEDNNPYGDKMDWQIGDGDRKAPASIRRPWLIQQQAYRLFYAVMPPWEYEEMGSVFGYLISKIKAIVEEISDDLRRLSKNTPCKYFWDILPKEQRPPPGCEIDKESDLLHFDQHFKGLAGLGPEFLYHILHLDRLSRRNIVCVNTRCYWPGPFIGLQMGLSWDERFPFIDPADRYEVQPFGNFELWSTCPPIEQPSVGWKKAWLLPHTGEDFLEGSMDLDREHEQDWGWCYALWDERRLQEWEAPFLEDGWSNEPPRPLREVNDILQEIRQRVLAH